MTRILTSLALVAMLFAGLFINSFFWLVFILVFCVGAAAEFSGIHFKGKLPALSVLTVAAAFAFPINAYLRSVELFNIPDSLMIASIIIIAPTLFVFSKGEIEDFKLSVPMALFGALWIGYLFSFNIFTYFIRVEGVHYGIQAVFLFAYLVCGNDVGAYFTGSNFGKHKMSKLYSPKKTWEGAFGGLGFAIFTSLVCHFTFTKEIPLIHTLVLAVLVVVTGSLGDLVESLFKRSSMVKDSGGILPGHGGIMDRADSILFASPAFFWYLHYMVAS